VITINSNTTIEQAAQIMVKNNVGCLPVIDDGIVMGMITENDLLIQLTRMMIGHEEGVRVTVRMPMVRGELAKLVAAIAEKGLGIVSMGGAVALKDPTKWDAVVKIRGTREEVLAALGEVEGHEILDVREVG
jgi:acetoin utilization protein AcuB